MLCFVSNPPIESLHKITKTMPIIDVRHKTQDYLWWASSFSLSKPNHYFEVPQRIRTHSAGCSINNKPSRMSIGYLISPFQIPDHFLTKCLKSTEKVQYLIFTFLCLQTRFINLEYSVSQSVRVNNLVFYCLTT